MMRLLTTKLAVIFTLTITVYSTEDLEPSAKSRQQQVKSCPVGSLERPHFEQEPRTWQKVADRQIIVYSAFFEERPSAHGPSIRIIAAGLQERFNKVGDLYCNLWYEDQDDAISTGPAIYEVIYPSLAHGDMWTSHFILCELPRGGVPYAVSITPTPCAKPENKLMVLNRVPIPRHKKDGHALCVQPLYNLFRNWTMVIEMFELHKLLGAKEITIYVFSVSEDTRKTLDLYVRESTDDFRVNVLPWPWPSGLLSNVMCQRGTLNDCYYRMRNKYKYITVTDLDEVLVPRMVHSWPELLSKISKDEYGAYLFQHAYFRRNYTLQEKEKQELISQSSFWRTDVVIPAGKIRSKAMYDADLAISLDLHSPYQLTSGAKEYIVDPSEGMLHHYRSYPMESFAKYPERYNYIEDRYMEWMAKALDEAYKRRVMQFRNPEHTEL